LNSFPIIGIAILIAEPKKLAKKEAMRRENTTPLLSLKFSFMILYDIIKTKLFKGR